MQEEISILGIPVSTNPGSDIPPAGNVICTGEIECSPVRLIVRMILVHIEIRIVQLCYSCCKQFPSLSIRKKPVAGIVILGPQHQVLQKSTCASEGFVVLAISER